MTMLRAKRAIEELLVAGRVFVDLPMVENPNTLAADLAKAGIAAAPVEPPRTVDVRALRERLRLTREPDTTARSYLRAISNDPEHVEEAYAPTAAV
ncbi:MAG: hypothetical protein ABI369_00570 [Acetobacteraceae bacterium]